MAKKNNEKQSTKKDKRGGGRRQERRFVSQAATNPTIVRLFGALAAIALGAGVWAYFYAQSFAEDEKLRALPSYLIAGGAVLLGITIWIGTSSEPPVRVGAPGISIEKGELRRMPWWAVEKIHFESGTLALVIAGKDEAGADWTFKVPIKAHPDAAAWIVEEALERIPRRVDISDEVLAKLPEAQQHAGQRLDLEPLQVVGKKDAVSGKTISYEPDARVCPRCERVYFKRSVPKKCRCGSSLAHLRPKTDELDESVTDDEDEVEDRAAQSDDDDRTSTATSAES